MAKEIDAATEIERLTQQQKMLVWTMRISLMVLLLMMVITCSRAAARIPNFSHVFRDMMPGSPLPFATRFVLDHPVAFTAAPLLLGVVGLAVLFGSRGQKLGVGLATAIIIVLFVEWQFLMSALQLPLFHLIQQIGQ